MLSLFLPFAHHVYPHLSQNPAFKSICKSCFWYIEVQLITTIFIYLRNNIQWECYGKCEHFEEKWCATLLFSNINAIISCSFKKRNDVRRFCVVFRRDLLLLFLEEKLCVTIYCYFFREMYLLYVVSWR